MNSPASAPFVIHSLRDRKSTRLNSSHSQISYAVFCLKNKTHLHSHSTPEPVLLLAQPPHLFVRRMQRILAEPAPRSVVRVGSQSSAHRDGIVSRLDTLAGVVASVVEVVQLKLTRKALYAEVLVRVGDVRVLLLDQRRDHVDLLGDVLGRARVLLFFFF